MLNCSPECASWFTRSVMRISTVNFCLHSSSNPTMLVSKMTSSTTTSASSRAIIVSRPGEGVSRRHTTAPSTTASAFGCSPAPRNSLKTTTAISWRNSMVLPPYPLLSMDVVMKDIGSQNMYNSVRTPPASLHPQTVSLQDSITKHISVGWRECRLQLKPTARK